MSATNIINSQINCPKCGRGVIKAVTKMASSYDGVDQRFMDFEYKMGDIMKWWPSDHTNFTNWIDSNQKNFIQTANEALECCYAECSKCHYEFYLELHFINLCINKIISFGDLSEWPSSYWK